MKLEDVVDTLTKMQDQINKNTDRIRQMEVCAILSRMFSARHQGRFDETLGYIEDDVVCGRVDRSIAIDALDGLFENSESGGDWEHFDISRIDETRESIRSMEIGDES